MKNRPEHTRLHLFTCTERKCGWLGTPGRKPPDGFPQIWAELLDYKPSASRNQLLLLWPKSTKRLIFLRNHQEKLNSPLSVFFIAVNFKNTKAVSVQCRNFEELIKMQEHLPLINPFPTIIITINTFGISSWLIFRVHTHIWIFSSLDNPFPFLLCQV